MAENSSCLVSGCRGHARVKCVRCHKRGCNEHIRCYFVGRVAYMDLCAACAEAWRLHVGDVPMELLAEPVSLLA